MSELEGGLRWVLSDVSSRLAKIVTMIADILREVLDGSYLMSSVD